MIDDAAAIIIVSRGGGSKMCIFRAGLSSSTHSQDDNMFHETNLLLT